MEEIQDYFNFQVTGSDISNFFGRKKEIAFIIENLSENDFTNKKIINIFGISGIGKSYICRYIFYHENLLQNYIKIYFDFNLLNRSLIELIETITLDTDTKYFSETKELLNSYYQSIDSSKPILFEKIIKSFNSEIDLFASNKPILLIFDTIELVSGNIEWELLLDFIHKTNNRICFLCSGIDKLSFNKNIIHYEIRGFSFDEISLYFSERIPNLRRKLKNTNSILPIKIHTFTQDGNPILCGLLSDWLIQFPEQYQFILREDFIDSERQLIVWINNLENKFFSVLQVMAYFSKRMDTKIICKLFDIDEDYATRIIENIGQFSFIKYYSGNNIILHDIVAELIKKYFPISENDLLEKYNSVINIYNNMINDAENFISKSFVVYLRLEKMYYTLLYGNKNESIEYFDFVFHRSLDIFDFSFSNLLLTELIQLLEILDDNHWDVIAQLSQVELLISQFRPVKALGLITKIKELPLYREDHILNAKVNEAYAKSIINPCTAAKLNLYDAIDYFKKCVSVYEERKITHRLIRSYLGLANAYVRSGQSDLAEDAFSRAERLCDSPINKINIYQEQSKMLRLQQKVNESLVPLLKCESEFEKINLNKGKYYYYLANTLRDLNEFNHAEKNYELALKELSSGLDNFTLAELYFDYSWMEYLRSEHVNFEKVYRLLNLGWNIAEEEGFGTEFSEYYHIKYEIEKDQEDYKSAFLNLDKALQYAYEYSNIYMILDCLNHRVQQYYFERNFDLIPNIISEMKKIERTGCGIKVFRGRAKLVHGDVFYIEKRFLEAFNEWKEGFCIVALYGNSRSNVELFQDLYYCSDARDQVSRRDKMIDTISNLDVSVKQELKEFWYKNRVDHQFDYFLDDLCK